MSLPGWFALGVVLLVLLIFAGVRLAPVDPASWHRPPEPRAPGDYPAATGFEAVRAFSDETAARTALVALDTAATATPRTRQIAGTADEGFVTYETRSRVWGFPDYTTVFRRDAVIHVFGRQRFGGYDHGVNRARIEAWMAAAGGFSRP